MKREFVSSWDHLPDASGSPRSSTYEYNQANQRIRNSQTPYRKGEYFRKEISVSNGSNPAWQSVTVTSPGETSVTGNAYVPKTPEQFAYDADGNLTSDGRWTYVWDAENRLVQMLPTTVVAVPDGAKRKLDFVYDYKGRRIQKAVSTWNGTGWSLTVSNRFLYDAWNMVAELNATNNAVIRTYLWGLDLSGSLQSAGGVGGLLAISDASKGRHFVSYDGNGNVMQTVASADGNISAVYEYGPFGELLRATGPMAKANPFRFSTKYQDDETDLLYYGYRYYNASAGRWISRDPVGEVGFNYLNNSSSSGNGGIISALLDLNPRFASKTKSQLSVTLVVVESRSGPAYAFLRNEPLDSQDAFGLYPAFKLYGNYCGPGWCNGRKMTEKACSCLKTPLVTPRDDMDSCCMAHDLCLGPATTKAQEKACDKAMCDCLKGVNPEDITPPPGWTLQQVNDVYQAMYGVFCSGIAH